MALPGRTLTHEEFVQFPERTPALEYLDGVVAQKVSPQVDHARLQSLLTQSVNQAAEPRRAGLAFTEARFSRKPASLVPDLSYYVKYRLPISPQGRFERYFREPPDRAVELRSPGRAGRPRSQGLHVGFRAGECG